MRERGSRHADAADDHNEQRQRHCEPPNNPAAGKAMQASPQTSPPTNDALLVARCDFPRRHAELIDVPIADDHLDRGCHFLIAVASLGVALPPESQALKLKLDCCIGIVSHDPSPSGPPTFAPNMAVGGRSLGTIWAVYLLAPNNERDQDFRLSPIYEGSCGHKKEPPPRWAREPADD
jgi:hypothetical protein